MAKPQQLLVGGDRKSIHSAPQTVEATATNSLFETGFGPSRHMPFLDGLRGVAVLAVIIFHLAGPIAQISGDWFPYQFHTIASLGQKGVNLFFVLSGFLIGGILIDTRNSNTYFKSFYVRRTLRIFPLYYAMGIFLCWILPALGGGDYFQKHQWWYWTYTSNLPQALGLNVDLGHFWSLAVEEHFYLIWPVLLWRLKPSGILWLCGGAILVSMLARIWFTTLGAPNATFTLCCIGQLASGTAIAAFGRMIGTGRRRLVNNVSAGIGLALVAVLIPLFFKYTGSELAILQISKSLFFSIFFSMLILYLITSTKNNIVVRCLSTKFLRLNGKYSYAMYVIHPIIIGAVLHSVAAQHSPLEVAGFIFIIAAGIALASLLSWHLLEKHFLRLKTRF